MYDKMVPRARTGKEKAWNRKIIWPRDKKQKSVHAWSRWKDLCTNKGPDMWISRRDSAGPHRPVWSGWNGTNSDNLGYVYQNDNHVPPLSWASRPNWQKYDFRKRKYCEPKAGAWSDVKWDAKGREKLYYRDRYHVEHVSPAYNDGTGHNPFAYHDWTPYWDWHYDTIFGPLPKKAQEK